MGISLLTPVRNGLFRIHLLGAVGVILYLVMAFLNAAGQGFTANRDLYARATFEPADAVEYLVETWKQTPVGVQGRVLTLWGLAENPEATALSEQDPGIIMARLWQEEGIQIRVATPHQEDARRLLGDAVSIFNNPLQAAQGAHAVALITERLMYSAVAMTDLAAALQGRMVLDGREFLNSLAADAAGLFYLSFAKPAGPPWLDGDFQTYVEHLQEKLPADARLLLLPVSRLATTSGRARWFLHLNYQLAPRHLYLWRPDLASGTSGQYRDWVLSYNKKKPWKRLQRWGPNLRDFSGMPGIGPARLLHEAERNFVQNKSITHILFFSHNSDFRATDWECIPVEDLR
ncbi:MAG: hypothetical protein OTJ44_01280 [Planctomycetota bacterium]|nr:hypothetical protein [Planctomycetota bacterium]